MKKYNIFLLMALAVALTGCDKFLDRKPLDQSSATNYLANQQEMETGLNGVYASNFWVLANNTPLLFAVEASTDLAIKRGGNAEDLAAMGDGGPFVINNALVNTCWSQAYKLVRRMFRPLSTAVFELRPWCCVPGHTCT
jgi:hypothetical protein